jgi:hypothetical protein
VSRERFLPTEMLPLTSISPLPEGRVEATQSEVKGVCVEGVIRLVRERMLESNTELRNAREAEQFFMGGGRNELTLPLIASLASALLLEIKLLVICELEDIFEASKKFGQSNTSRIMCLLW